MQNSYFTSDLRRTYQLNVMAVIEAYDFSVRTTTESY